MTQKTNQDPWTMDLRLRDRNIRAGVISQKDVEKYLAQLPDLAEQAEPFGIPQPALAQPPAEETEQPAAAAAEQPAAEGAPPVAAEPVAPPPPVAPEAVAAPAPEPVA